MRLLLDTHAWLWHFLGDASLSASARAVIDDPANEKWVSVASCWEVAIKMSTGKYTLHVSFPVLVQSGIFANRFNLLPVEPRHLEHLLTLPFHHRDPFDRLLVAQATADGLTLVSCDTEVAKYPVPRVW
jgi:PIN domain nuclease of toxin-antitoxin system